MDFLLAAPMSNETRALSFSMLTSVISRESIFFLREGKSLIGRSFKKKEREKRKEKKKLSVSVGHICLTGTSNLIGSY